MQEFEGPWSEDTLDYFLNNKQIKARDGAEIIWYHSANSKAQLSEALAGSAHMIEADVICAKQSGNEEPIMAHPPQTDSDITLWEWLNEVVKTNKGIKLDFKSLEAVKPSMVLLDQVKTCLKRPVWINADILPGPGGTILPLDAERFLEIVTSFFSDVTLSLGWTTGWHPQKCNEGYSSEMMEEMERISHRFSQAITFPVRAALVRQSWSELHWLLQGSDKYSMTVWTGKDDVYSLEDLLFIREKFDKNKVYFDLPEPRSSEFRQAIENEIKF
ncbi:protein FAM151B isoform X2 [Microcaecilia unicolor]|uniref:Protein FAM151B isoform X1 n=1 Tax=Microcaecilia unicolor TaxID=1415580 RepID=A0A6P7XC49_9AMPH|nr:protein FAM151B isoform X1 [Microcaecilia unicolor]XP_030048166.1 protein FAM151B isoform X2 [Microcaecilia unicolor]